NVFAEAATGGDGVFQQAYDELKTAEDVRVFATVDTHTASNVVGLQGVGVASGLTDRGYIYTDRPAYRAGQIVHVRGCLRGVSNDAYRIDAGKQYVLEIFDGRNRLVHQADVTLNPFGSFHAHCVLPQTSPQGEYRVLVRDADERSYQGSFLVHEFQLEPIRLVVDVPRTVYYRGEEIRGKIRAEYYYGAPLADAELRYRLADDRVHTARTDQQGEAEFTLPTREFLETQVLPFIVELPERNLRHVSNFLLASHGFSLRLETIRPVYVAGETFEVSVVAADAEGKPTGRKLTLKVFQQTNVQGKVGERLVGSHELETDAQQGRARQVLKLDEGGSYVLRAEGMDQFNNPISGQHVVQISDDKDQVRLRILAERHTYKVGDTATVKVHWREQPAMGLVTFQGARILGYRLIQLNNGVNELSVPMEARLAPNFELAVAVMTDVRTPSKDGGAPPTRFHESSSPFVVEQDLRLTVAAKRKAGGEGPIQPGEEVEVALTARDAQGRPVSAEISLAMVEQSLLERFPASLAAIQDFFRGEFRQSAVRTGSSIQFTYHPATQAINARLLAEDDRLAVEADEAASRAAEMTLAEDLEARPGDRPAPAATEPAAAFDDAAPTVMFGLQDSSGRVRAGDFDGVQSALGLSRARFGKPGQTAGLPARSADAAPLGQV
ncbi:MAG: hypothetical protein FJ276_35440, partial [Planctomycetes bacterium]|nr:hypothetical protein [Planctomycetota bacterium]